MRRWIAVLAALNIIQLSVVVALLSSHRPIHAGTSLNVREVGPMHVDIRRGGQMDVVTTGDQGDGKLVLTPHAALKLHDEIGDMFRLIERAAQAQKRPATVTQ
jgi:hypothetical protein